MVNIVKADGTVEPYREEKLRRSLANAQASKDEVTDILAQVEQTLHEGMTTEEIYRNAFAILRSVEVPVAARYSLRRALFNLGPTGFPFEKFLARIFEHEGYTTKTGIMLNGKCAPHEIDVAAYKDDHAFIAEAKFHARPGVKSDLQVALYCYARKLDLAGVSICEEDHCGVTDFMVITNTKFTSTAREYAACAGLSLLSWDYPKEANLHARIKATGLYPITVLQGISGAQKRALIERGVIVCSDLVAQPHLLRHAHLGERKVEAVLSEARQLCHAS